MNSTCSEDVKGSEIEKLKKEYLNQVEKFTPKEVKEIRIFDPGNPNAQEIKLDQKKIEELKLGRWFENYSKEAVVSTGGIRGPQNILYPWDPRYPIHELGVILATLGKARVLKEDIRERPIHKLCSGEVRYNTDRYTSLISRAQAAEGIITHTSSRRTSIWMASFLIFMLDYDGGEYVTSSHGISSKTATKDLDNQGSQFIPEMSARFVKEIGQILEKGRKEGITIKIGPADHENIRADLDGTDQYVEYLKKGVATKENLDLIRNGIKSGLEIMFECVGGCMYRVMLPIFERLGIKDAYSWNNTKEDPFFHGIGKVMENPVTKNKEFFDYGCDTTIRKVMETIGYGKLLADKPAGYQVIQADPDGDRIVIGQIEPVSRKEKIEELGIPYINLTKEKIFSFFTPNQSFLMTMDFHACGLKESGVWKDHPRFIITTTPSAASWVEWAEKVGSNYLYVPVGFKEIANIMKKVEASIEKEPDKEVIITDIFGREVNLGIQPRLVFTGEESGGMITGPEELIRSRKGRLALAMREKSAGEASVLVSAMMAKLFIEKKLLSDYLEEIFIKYDIKRRYDIRVETRFYNESNPDPDSLRKEKAEGEVKRDRIDNFFLSIALQMRINNLGLSKAREILQEALPDLDFSNLSGIHFVGDGTYFDFEDKYVEIRKSGTDAIIKAYSAGEDKKECIRYATAIANYDGKETPLFRKEIDRDIYANCQKMGMDLLRGFQKA